MSAAKRPAVTPQVDSQHQQQQAPLHLPVLDSVLDYEKLHRIGEGTYGVVYKGKLVDAWCAGLQVPSRSRKQCGVSRNAAIIAAAAAAAARPLQPASQTLFAGLYLPV